MRVLIIGGGGREHALAWKVAQSPRVTAVHVAPGNAGTAREAGVRNVPVQADDIDGLLSHARDERIDLAIVGPEGPLVKGVVDAFTAAGIACFGPTAAAARLEGSKSYAKEFMARHGIPTAAYRVFTAGTLDEEWIRARHLPLVVKADGLAAGKGVVIAETHEAALGAVRSMFEGEFGAAGREVVVEGFLLGEEASFIALVDGETVLPLATSQDHKRLRDGDLGPNTGGMGAYSPAPVVTPAVHERAMREVMLPTVRALAAAGTPYRGFLYAGLMVAADGTPNVLEFNCRFGDPETQPVLMRLKSDLVDLIGAAFAGRLAEVRCDWDPRPAVGVVIAAGGYPDKVRTGAPVEGLAAAGLLPGKIFHAGTRELDGTVQTSGGRVLCATALGATVAAARDAAYALVDAVHFEGMQFRRDIAHRALARPG
jgi:phosphoribosylamine---glycine ligase